jgi:hypothetical protein
MKRRWLLTLILVAIVAAFAVIAPRFRKPAASQSLVPLCEFVESHGQPELLYPVLADYFGLPQDDGQLLACSVSENGHKRSIEVRRRTHSATVDILFMDEQPGGYAAYFYQANENGELIKSVYLEAEPRTIDDANKRFEKEKAFWLTWLHEKLNHPSS